MKRVAVFGNAGGGIAPCHRNLTPKDRALIAGAVGKEYRRA
jgi:hypothetical protein